MSDFAIDAGTTWPPLQLALTNNGAAVDLSLAQSVTLILQNPLSGTVTLVGAMTVLDAAGGLVQYRWDSDDTAVHGNYQGKVQVVWAGGAVQNFPRGRYLWIEIDDAPLTSGLSVTEGGDDAMFSTTPVLITSLTATPFAVKTTTGSLVGLQLDNPNTLDVWVQLFDAATVSVTPGTTVPRLSFKVPAGGSLDQDFEPPMSFATAITLAATTTQEGGTGPAVPLTGDAEVLS